MGAGARRLTQAMRSLEAAFLIDVDGVTEIWLIRHGDCYEDMDDDVDPPLSARGRKQVEKLAARVRRARPAAVYSSPHKRAMETARAMSDDVHIDKRLIEMELTLGSEGELEFTELPNHVIERMSAAIDDIASAHPGQLRLLPHYTSVSVVRALGDRRMVGALGDRAHLE